MVVYVLLHEIGHANDPTFSVTMDQELREEVNDWLGVRVRHMDESDYVRHATLSLSHTVNRVENETRRWLGSRYAFPVPGEGSLPMLYPTDIHANTPLEERNLRSVEYYAEAVAITKTVNLPDEAYLSDAAWEASAAQEIRIHNHYRIAVESERGESELADALEHVRFVRRLIPDIRTRNQAYHNLVQSGRLAELIVGSH